MIQQKLQETDWEIVANEIHQNGFAILPNMLSDEQCQALKAGYYNPNAYRKTVVM
jgi:hypothetical protein